MYELSAVIAGFELLCGCTAGAADCVPVAVLRQGLGLVPAADVPVEEAAASGARGLPGTRPGRPESAEPRAAVSPAFGAVVAWWSRQGTVAYVEADFAGGAGWQRAVVWRAGARLWGPAYETEFRGPRSDWPVNHALALLGAVPRDQSSFGLDSTEQAVCADLFHRVGLGWERGTDGWRTVGRADREAGYAAALERREGRFRADAEHEHRRRLDRLPAVLDGRTIMEVLGVGPGPLVGAAARHLKELTREHGALTRDEAAAALRIWARGRVVDGEGGAGLPHTISYEADVE